MSEDKKKACLLAWLGSETYALLENLFAVVCNQDSHTQIVQRHSAGSPEIADLPAKVINAIISATLMNKLEISSSNTLLTLTYNNNVCWI
ncbi:unnamed protein product [Clavelina lepadiformis]|uniref:Uncharacterized protein n=1 Tax=Clavelina lepadiformis TaxID=159417 RepID=A0ABP0G3L0_CLALP